MAISEDFFSYLDLQRKYSEHTILAYQGDLQQFQAFLSDRYSECGLLDVHQPIIRTWVVSLMEEGVSRLTIKRKVSALRSFYRYALKRGLVELNPASNLVLPKPPQSVLRVPKEEEMEQLWRNFPREEGYWGTTQGLIMEVLYETGIRRAELIDLELGSLRSGPAIKVFGKRKKERIIPISERLASDLRGYIENQRSQVLTEESGEFLFLSAKGKKLYPKLVYNLVNTYLSYVSGIDKKSPHSLRHAFATHLLNQGADINTVKELLGHSSLAATQVYTHNSIEHLKSMYNHAHPRAPKSKEL